MSCEIGINDRVFCDSVEEAMSFDGTNVDGKGFMDTIVDTSSRVVGGAVSQAKGILQAPAYIAQYVTCTVPSFGEWDPSWLGFGQNCSWQQNPLTRTMHVGNLMVFGMVNDVTGGAAHDVVREVAGSQSYSAQHYFPELDRSPEGLGGFAVRILSAAAAARGMQAKLSPVEITLPKAEPVAYGTPTVLDRSFAKSVFDRPMPAMGAPILSTYAALTVVIETLARHLESVREMKYVAFRRAGEGLQSVVGETTVEHPTLVPNGSTIVGAGYARFERLPNGGTKVTLDGKSGNFPTGSHSVEIRMGVVARLRELTTDEAGDSGFTPVAAHWRQVLGDGVVVEVDTSNKPL